LNGYIVLKRAADSTIKRFTAQRSNFV